MQQFLSSLARGSGKDAQIYDDHKINFLRKIPYTLGEIKLRKKLPVDLIYKSKFKRLPGTYLTEKGQLILYTKAQHAKGINLEVATFCKNVTYLYDMVQNLSPIIKENDINGLKNENKFGDLSSALVSLKNNWFYPQQWKSSAKSLIPDEAKNLGHDIKDYIKSKDIKNNSNFNNSPKKINEKYQKYFRIYQNPETLPRLTSENMNLIHQQKQNNALEKDVIRSTSSKTTSKDTSISISSSLDNLIPNFTDQESPYLTESCKLDNDSDDSCYEADDELIIRPIKSEQIKELADDESIKSENNPHMNITDILGDDLILNDIKTVEPSLINLKSLKSASLRNQKNEELRFNLLQDMYCKLNFLSTIKTKLKGLGEQLLNYFQNFNAGNRKLRFQKSREDLYDTLKDMKFRNDEIHLRLRKLSEKTLLENKKKSENAVFRKQWDNMLLELSLKAKLDNEVLQSRMEKLVQHEELKFKEKEHIQLQLELSSLKYAFMKLKEELIKIEEKKNEIEHFIIRLEMRRENINKIEREILTSTPDVLNVDISDISSLIKNVKEDVVILWKSKMGAHGDDLKMEEIKMIKFLNKESNFNSLPKEKENMTFNDGDVNIDINLINPLRGNKKQSDRLNNKEDFEFPIKNQNNYLSKLDYEMLKHGQNISSTYSYSYFVHWPRENYKRNYLQPRLLDDESIDERKPKTCELDYKRILANNPLLKKRRRLPKSNLK